MSGLKAGSAGPERRQPLRGLSQSGWGSPGVPRLGGEGASRAAQASRRGGLGGEPEAGPHCASSLGQRDLGKASQLDSLAGLREDFAF